MKKLLTILSFLLAASLQAAEVVYDFSSAIPQGWTTSAKPNGFETSGNCRGTQFTSNATLTLKGATNVSKVTITCSCNIEGKNAIAVSVGGKAWGTEVLPKANDMEKVFTSATTSGDIVLTLTRADKSIYIKKIVVEGTVSGGEGGGDNNGGGDPDDLKPDYTYAEPTIIGVSGAMGNNAPYSFIQNNIKVSATTGAQTETYFGCNAGATLTFTATRAIKSIAIDGYVKKDFAATTDHGTIYYVDASEDYVEADPVVVITGINSKTVSILCEKQLRCYSVEFYFDEDIDPELGEGSEEGEYSFDYEPTEQTTISTTFSEMSYLDYTDYIGMPATYLLAENDECGIELMVFAQSVATTGLPVGTYLINDTYEEGTVQASPGGDDEYDYPSFLYTGFEYDPEYDETYYTDTYYIESGTLTVATDPAGIKLTLSAKSHFGSTINATFTGRPSVYDEEGISPTLYDSVTTASGKFLNRTGIILRHNGRTYNLQATRIR